MAFFFVFVGIYSCSNHDESSYSTVSNSQKHWKHDYSNTEKNKKYSISSICQIYGQPDKIEKCRDFDKLRPENRYMTYYWYSEFGDIYKTALITFDENGVGSVVQIY